MTVLLKNKLVSLGLCTWLAVFLLVMFFDQRLPWLRGDEWGIGHAFTLVAAVVGLLLSLVATTFAYICYKEGHDSMIPKVALYINYAACLFALFAVPILWMFD